MIYLGSDHGGFKLKQQIKKWLSEWGYGYQDLGNSEFDEVDDYPQYALQVATKVAENEPENKGVLVCRSAVGMVIAANKIKGARAAAVYDEEMGRLVREHNNANIIGLSGDRLSAEEAKKILKKFLETDFSQDERHRRRVKMIGEFEGK